ncbi:MAG TPA: DNA mismatch repair protein MutS [Nitrospirae bacterium]|nr:DNA mismatch repair protein MutS [Nitrospirota bacterium]
MMKVFLMHPDRDFDPNGALPPNEADLVQDLELNTLFAAMAREDKFLFLVARQAVLSSLDDIDTIHYRQEILKDCLKRPSVVRQIYRIPIEFMERKRRQWLWISTRHSNPSSILSSALHMLEASLDLLRMLRQIADEYAEAFESTGFCRLFAMIQQELDDEYLSVVEKHIKVLRFPGGALLSAQLGRGNEGTNYVLCKPNDSGQNWIKRIFAQKSPVYSFTLHPRDDHGARALGKLQDRGLTRVANAVAQAAEHIESFFNVLRLELAFYLSCLNLYEQLEQLGEPVAFPQPVPACERRLSCMGLYDVTLALTMKQKVVGNDIATDGKDLMIITGPNQGGKTTFLRSIGLSQLMMQCGMFVPAESLSANLYTGLFTHFKREEDKTMESGKFGEELKRMSTIVDLIMPDSLILLNESFAATNEREGSEIAGQIVSALIEKRIKVFYVTHLYEFAYSFYEKGKENVLFLRAERLQDRRRTFRLKEGEPLKTSYAADLYNKIFKKGARRSEHIA